MAKLSNRVHLTIRRFTHGMTLGVRVAAFNSAGALALVRHSYTPGWHMPGGGVDKGETIVEAAARELFEETGARALSDPALVGVYLNRAGLNRDHIALMRVDQLSVPDQLPKANLEIVEVGFFDLNALPEGTTPATQRRLAELAGQQPIAATW